MRGSNDETRPDPKRRGVPALAAQDGLARAVQGAARELVGPGGIGKAQHAAPTVGVLTVECENIVKAGFLAIYVDWGVTGYRENSAILLKGKDGKPDCSLETK